MFIKLIKPIAIIIALCIIIPSSESWAQRNKNKFKDPEIAASIQKYIKSEILPKLKELKTELDKGLPSEDLNTLNDLRAKAKKIRSQIFELRKEIREAHRNGDGDKFDAKRDEIEELHDQMLDLLEQLKPIAEKNKDLLKSIGTKAKPFVNEWRDDIRDIIKGWMQEHKSELCNKMGDRRCKNFNNNKMRDHFGFNFDRRRAVARFMLWDGTDDFLDEFEERIGEIENSFGKGIGQREKGFECYNYPNPFSDRTKFSFYIPEDENVIITLSDNSGKKIGEIFNGKLPAGDHIIYFEPNNSNFKNLLPGAYYYKIQAGKWNKSGKMIYGK